MKTGRSFLFLLILMACNNAPSGYREIDEGLYYRLLSIGEAGESMQKGDYLSGRVSIFSLAGDTLFYQPAEVTFQLKGTHRLDTIFSLFNLEDSLSVQWRPGKGEGMGSLAVFVPEDTFREVKIDLKVNRIRSASIYRKDSLLYAKHGKMNEQLLLKRYLEDHNLSSSDAREGIYFQLLHRGKGQKAPAVGNTLRVEYVARFLDGRIFDATSRWKEAFVFEYGRPFQLIPGLETSLSWMKQGDVAKIILPSQLAFGEIGSAGTVPPNTTVVYELKLAEIY